MSKKIILTIGISTFIILGIVSYIWKINKINPNSSSSSTATETSKPPITPTSDNNISDWKTYRNETIGIEFKYPNNWPNLESNNIGDEMRNGKSFTSFSLNLPDLSLLNHTFLNMDNMSIDEQYEKIKCEQDNAYIECKEKISDNGVKYIWIIEETKGGPYYEALVATGKYILIFNFQEKDNYEKRASEYQELLLTLKIVPIPAFNSDISDWKTYRNEKYGFELKFPKEYELNNDYSIWTLSNESNILSEWGVNKKQETIFGIDVYSKAEKTSLLNRFGNEVADSQELLINNIVAKKLEGGETSWNVLMIENENYIYIISSSFFPLNNNQEYNEYEVILSTFQLIK